MDKEKRIWLFEQYANKMWTIAINLTTEAARIDGESAKGLAIVAEECRNLAEKILLYVMETRFHGGQDEEFKGIADAAFQMNLLAVNGCIENVRGKTALNGGSDYRAVSVCMEEIRSLACKVATLVYKNEKNHVPQPIPEVISPLKSTEMSEYFLQYSIGGIPFVENVGNIGSIEYPEKSALQSEIFNLRGTDVKVIDLYKRFNLKNSKGERQEIMVIWTDENKSNESLRIVPVDGVYGIIMSRIGYNVPPKAGHVFAEYARECWDVIGDDQFIFIDWQKFI